MLRAVRLPLFFIIAFSGILPADTLDIAITRQSRKIQHDGFLMEWKTSTARYWDNNGSFIMDAAITSEGIAGYFRSKKPITCKNWVFSIASPAHHTTFTLTIPEDTTQVSAELRLDKLEFDENGVIAVEWLIPPIDSTLGARSEAIFLSGTSRCGDTFPVLRLQSIPAEKAPAKKTSGLLLKGILVLFLGGMYLLVHRKIKLQTQQKVSPRQSA